tara:strand:- start:2506 stop:2928 length:423 start_codon:yes stop_codon:yes gene_type:complete
MINIKFFIILSLFILGTSNNVINGFSFSKLMEKYEIIKYNTDYSYYDNFKLTKLDSKKNFCVNCKYYLPFIYCDTNHRTKYAKCNKFILPDIKKEDDAIFCIYPVDNKAIFDYFEFCKDCRKDENKCGIDGKCFEEKFSL